MRGKLCGKVYYTLLYIVLYKSLFTAYFGHFFSISYTDVIVWQCIMYLRITALHWNSQICE